ncbi:MAG: hypothetical protein PHC64_10215 [Candidatus Gastranaerophilales bacterium]|nr:hypothetical protein [Candidatus Gastranaerophilales bacterium]
MEIKSISQSISQKIFNRNASNKIENNTNHTNPFGVNFKGSIISADVFESEKTESKNPFAGISSLSTAASKGRMWASATVGAVGQAIGRRLDTVVSFGRRMKDGIASTWNYLNTTNARLDLGLGLVKRDDNTGLINLSFTGNGDSVKNLRKRPVSDLRDMFTDAIAKRTAGVVA